MALLEVITGLQTSNETLEVVFGLGKRLKKEVVVSKDSPGFILNRALVPYLNEAIYVLYEGLATKEDIDKAMRLGSNGIFYIFFHFFISSFFSSYGTFNLGRFCWIRHVKNSIFQKYLCYFLDAWLF